MQSEQSWPEAVISCLNNLAPPAFVQALPIHVISNTGKELELLRASFKEQPSIHLHALSQSKPQRRSSPSAALLSKHAVLRV